MMDGVEHLRDPLTRANRILALLIDQDSGGPVVPIFIHHRPEGGHRIRVLPSRPDPDPDRDDAETLTALYTATIEAHIRQ